MTGKEALEKIKHIQIGNPKGCSILWDEYEEEISTIAKDLENFQILKKAYELIVKKHIAMEKLMNMSIDTYNYYYQAQDKQLTKEEYDLCQKASELLDGDERR